METGGRGKVARPVRVTSELGAEEGREARGGPLTALQLLQKGTTCSSELLQAVRKNIVM